MHCNIDNTMKKTVACASRCREPEGVETGRSLAGENHFGVDMAKLSSCVRKRPIKRIRVAEILS